MSRMIFFRRLLLLSVAAWLVWRIVAVGLSAHYMESPQATPDAASKALAWNPRQPVALYRRGLALREQDPDAAATLLARAYTENPTDVRPLVALARLSQTQDDQERSEALLATALRLAPADPRVHQQAAEYWVARGDIEAALRHWSSVLEIDPARKDSLFPTLLRIAEDPRTRLALQPFATAPASWWASFFAEVAAKARETETIRILYALRKDSPQEPVTDEERKAFVERMMVSGHVAEAYVDWVGGLDRQQRQALGLLYNGGFELEPLNWGFGWRIRSRPQALVDRGTTFGVEGDQALRLIFRRYEGHFAGIAQSLFLDPGRYQLTGRVRTDSLESAGGIRWSVQCMLPEDRELGASERFLGANQWRGFAFEFAVPEACALQELRLVSAGERTFERRISGSAWFDRFAIRKLAGGADAPDVDEPDADESDADERPLAGDG